MVITALRLRKSGVCVGPYIALTLNRIPHCDYTHYRIREKIYDGVPVYDLPDSIAIIEHETEAFVGATVEFVTVVQK